MESDSHRPSLLALGFVALLAAGWALWFFGAQVAVVAVAETARLEVDRAAHAIEAPVAGTITAAHLELGQKVRGGDVLVELDSEALRLSVEAERARGAAAARQIEALRAELATAEKVIVQRREVATAKADEARAHTHEADAVAILSESERDRSLRLQREGLASEGDATRAKAEAEQRRAVADGARLAVARLESEQRATDSEGDLGLSRIRRELAELEGQEAISRATLAELEHAILLRRIRAPVDGELGEVATLRVGSVVKEGDQLGAVVPRGKVRIVAEFLPADAVGRVRTGQNARLRPDGFPWTEYGTLSATVQRVANEPRSGRIRVELEVRAPSSSRIPIQHGLPGALEVEIERVSPAVLVLRAAGQRLSAPSQPNLPSNERDEDGTKAFSDP